MIRRAVRSGKTESLPGSAEGVFRKSLGLVLDGGDPDLVAEATRYRKERGVDAPSRDIMSQLESLTGKNRLLVFSKVPKIGVNPRTEYDTPVGVYAYLFSKAAFGNFVDIERGGKGGRIISRSSSDMKGGHFWNRPYITVVDPPSNAVHVRRGGGGYSSSALDLDLGKIMKWTDFTNHFDRSWKEKGSARRGRLVATADPWSGLLPGPRGARGASHFWTALQKELQDPGRSLADGFRSALEAVYSRDQKLLLPTGTLGSNPPPFQILWLTLREVADRDRVRWSVLLRKLGYEAVIDHGTGTIHPVEPYQAVILNPTKATIVGQFRHPRTRTHERDRSDSFDEHMSKIVEREFAGVVEVAKKYTYIPFKFVAAGIYGHVDLTKVGGKSTDRIVSARIFTSISRQKESEEIYIRVALLRWNADSTSKRILYRTMNHSGVEFWKKFERRIPPDSIPKAGEVLRGLLRDAKDFIQPGLFKAVTISLPEPEPLPIRAKISREGTPV